MRSARLGARGGTVAGEGWVVGRLGGEEDKWCSSSDSSEGYGVAVEQLKMTWEAHVDY